MEPLPDDVVDPLLEVFPEDIQQFEELLAEFHSSLPGVPTNPITSDEMRNFLQLLHFSDDADEASYIVDSIVSVIHPVDLANLYYASTHTFQFQALNRIYTLSKLVKGHYADFEEFCDAAQAWAGDPQVLQLYAEGSEFAVLLRTTLSKLMMANWKEVNRIQNYIPEIMKWKLTGVKQWNVKPEKKEPVGDSVLMTMYYQIRERDRGEKLFKLSPFRLSVLFRAYHRDLRRPY